MLHNCFFKVGAAGASIITNNYCGLLCSHIPDVASVSCTSNILQDCVGNYLNDAVVITFGVLWGGGSSRVCVYCA